MKEALFLIVEENGIRIDLYISQKETDFSRSQVQKWIGEGKVLVNGKPCDKKYKVVVGDKIEIIPPEPILSEALPENIPLDIIYEDQDVLVINKARGMVVHPAPGNYTGTLVNALLYHCGESLSGIGGVIRPGIVHRIDKDTSGLLMVAKNDKAHIGLSNQIADHSFLRRYRTVVHGTMSKDSGVINAPIGRSFSDRKKMAVIEGGREAVSRYTLIEQRPKYAMLQVELETGRTHQIRVHLKYIQHPVAGDPVYGISRLSKAEETLEGQWLHAETLGFQHPISGKYLEFSVDPPQKLMDFWDRP